MEKRRVVITGLGTVNPLGNNVSASWDAAMAGKCGIGPITQFDASEFKCKLAGEVKNFDPETEQRAIACSTKERGISATSSKRTPARVMP